MTGDLEIRGFADVQELWGWLADNHQHHPGLWVRLGKARGGLASITFHDLLEAGIAHGWSESTRRGHEETSYLQRFTPRRTRGTTSARNVAIAARLEAEGRMTEAGRRALNL